jgi:hypothetical protein
VRTAVDMLASDARARFESKFDVRSRMSNRRHFKNPLVP